MTSAHLDAVAAIDCPVPTEWSSWNVSVLMVCTRASTRPHASMRGDNAVCPSMSRKTGRSKWLRLYDRGNTACPICLTGFTRDQASSGRTVTLEHVAIKALGGQARCLTCRNCNAETGRGIDQATAMRARPVRRHGRHPREARHIHAVSRRQGPYSTLRGILQAGLAGSPLKLPPSVRAAVSTRNSNTSLDDGPGRRGPHRRHRRAQPYQLRVDIARGAETFSDVGAGRSHHTGRLRTTGTRSVPRRSIHVLVLITAADPANTLRVRL